MASDEEEINAAKKRAELLAEFFLLNDFSAKGAFTACLNYVLNVAHKSGMPLKDFEATLFALIDIYRRGEKV